jgi:hypothetical protein
VIVITILPSVVDDYNIWVAHIREEYRLRMPEKGCRREESGRREEKKQVAEDNWNEELHNLQSPSNITKPEIGATCSMQVRGDKCTHSY